VKGPGTSVVVGGYYYGSATIFSLECQLTRMDILAISKLRMHNKAAIVVRVAKQGRSESIILDKVSLYATELLYYYINNNSRME
jgi:hypothetical protein